MKSVTRIIILSAICIYFVSRMPIFAWGFSDDNYYGEEYYGDEPDITDGDLEDKLVDWGLYEELFPDEVFAEEFYSTEIPRELYDEYDSSGMCAEDFVEQKTNEYFSDKSNWTNDMKIGLVEKFKKQERETIPQDIKELYSIRINGQTMSIDQIMEKCDKASGGQISKSNAKTYDPNEEPYLKNLCEQYGEDLLTTIEVYYYGKPCRYNKETKMFVAR